MLVVEVEDCQASYEALKEAGVPFCVSPTHRPGVARDASRWIPTAI